MVRWIRTASASSLMASAAIMTTLPVQPLGAQERPGDQVLSLDLEQEFGTNDNLGLRTNSPGSTTWSDTKLSFGFRNDTPNQFIDLRLSGVLRAVDFPLRPNETGFRDPVARVLYSRESANSRFSFDIDYQRPDLAFTNPLTRPDLDVQDLLISNGTREDVRGNIRFETGRLSSLGLILTASTRQRYYSDLNDDPEFGDGIPSFFDNETNTASATGLFRFNSITTGTLTLSQRQYRDENGRRVDTTTATVGIIHDFSEIDLLQANIGYSEVDESFGLIPLENTQRSTVGSITYRRELANGFAIASLDSSLTERGIENTLRFGRDTAFPASNFSWRLGLAQGENVDLQPIGLLRYDAVLPTGSLTALLSREVRIDSTVAQFTATSRARVNYRYEVNSLSAIGFSVDYADISRANDDGAGRGRATIRADYTRDVTRDWQLNMGYEHRLLRPADGRDADSNALTVSLRRRFELFQ